MGRYLAIGLMHEMSVSRSDLKKEKISKEELRQEIGQSLLFDLNLYDESETKKHLLFTLKNQVMESSLIPFLEAFYPLVYKDANDGLRLLNLLRSSPAAEWIDLAREKSCHAFQYDKYAEPDYIYFSKPFDPYVCLEYGCVILYLEHGKIVTEGIEGFLHFFKRCFQETFKEHPIAKSIQAYITG